MHNNGIISKELMHKLYCIAYHYLLDRMDSEDCVQTVLLRFYRHPRNIALLDRYLTHAVKMQAFDNSEQLHINRDRMDKGLANGDYELTSMDNFRGNYSRLSDRFVRKGLSTLSNSKQQILKEYYWDDKEVDEIYEDNPGKYCSPIAIRSEIKRAYDALRKHFGSLDDAWGGDSSQAQSYASYVGDDHNKMY